MDWKQNQEKLRQLIENPAAGLLLNAEIDYDANGDEVHRPRAAFRLTSGKYRRHFISLWELFDNPIALRDCVDMLVARAATVCAERHFNTIVTCTPTAREILHHVQPALEGEIGHDLFVSDFGDYPWATSGEVEPHIFQSRSVLVFTDVMASGTLVREMSARVVRTGGQVVAALCVVLSDEKLAAKVDSEGMTLVALDHGVPSRPIYAPVYSLITYPLPDLEPNDFDPSAVRRIDFVSVFPEFTPPGQIHSIQPLVNRTEMFAQLRQTEALAFGFYRADGRNFSLGLRIEKLLSSAREEDGSNTADKLWQSMWPAIKGLPPDAVLVSTFKKDDLRFTEFLRQRLEQEGRTPDSLVLKRELGDSPHLHHALFRHVKRVRNRDLILARAAATTSEEMRSLTALLAGEHVASITVLCLVNRMGVYAASFVHRIRQLVTGGLGGNQNSEGHAKFNFVPVYNVNDLRTDDLQRMYDRVAATIERFSRGTDVAHFKHLAETFARMIAPRSVHTYSFESEEQDFEPPVGGAFKIDNKAIPLPEAVARCAEEILHHRIHLALALVETTERADVFVHVTGLLIADIDFLRLSGQLGQVRAIMHERIAALRAIRLSAEPVSRDSVSDPLAKEEFAGLINHCLELETHLLFCAGLLAHFDKNQARADAILEEVLFADCSSAEWHKHPLNLSYHFRDVRNYWLAVFFLHAAHPDLYEQANSQAMRKALATRLRDRFTELLAPLTEEAPNETEDRVLLRNQIREMMNLLLVDLGVHTHREWHQRIRYLQTHVLRDSEKHSPLWTALKTAYVDFQDFVKSRGDTAVEERLPRRVREALNAAITLREVGEVARRLAFYPSHAVADQLQPLFADRMASHSFHRTVAQLVEFLQQCQKSPPQSPAECEEFWGLLRDTRHAVFDLGCPLRKALLSFCVPVYTTMLDALVDANGRLENEGLEDVWSTEIAALQARMAENGEPHVLVDPRLLHEILRNTFSNVRYNIAALVAEERPLRERVKLTIDEREDLLPDPESSPARYIVITVIAEGVSYQKNIEKRRPQPSTVDDQKARVREFCGEFTINDGPGGVGSETQIKLLSRDVYARFHMTELSAQKEGRI